MDKVITISREFGSGGRELGIKLAGLLKIPFYDKELISMAVDDSNLAEKAFTHYDEHMPELLDRSRYTPFSSVYEIPMSDQIFLIQSKVIRKLAEKGPCVIVGRCADMVLDISLNLFIYSRMKNRVNRLKTLETGVEEALIEQKIREMDRKRKDYYQYYTGNTWGKAQNYHLSLDSSEVGIEGCIQTIMTYLKAMQGT